MIKEEYDASVDVLVVDGKVDFRQSNKKELMDAFVDVNEIEDFACRDNMSIDWLKAKAKELRLITTMTGRSSKTKDRIGFGLSKKVVKVSAYSRT